MSAVPFDPTTLIGKFVYVDGVPGADKVPRTREGNIQGVREKDGKTVLLVMLYGGTASPNPVIEVGFDEKRWRLRFGRRP